MKHDDAKLGLLARGRALLSAVGWSGLLYVALIVVAHAAGSVPVTGEAELVKPYRLAPGDRITVIVFGEPDLSGDFLVDGGGSVSLPLIGATSVNNLTLQE